MVSGFVCLFGLRECLLVCLVFACLLYGRICSACLRFLAGALRKGRYGLFIMTGAKHRVRSKHHGRALQATRYGGARGSNPSQKTPRQRGEFIPSRTQCAFYARSA